MTRSVFLFSVLFPTTALAGSAEIISAVEAKYATVEAMSASFTQETKSEAFGADVQKGEMVLKRPAMMRWTFAGAHTKEFVTNGTTMWIYNAAEKQVLKYNDVSATASSADALLQSLNKISEIFEVDVLTETKDQKRLALTPKDAAGQVKRIELSLDGSYVIQSLIVTDSFGTQTTLGFTNVVLNPKVDDSRFVFEPPPGVKVEAAN